MRFVDLFDSFIDEKFRADADASKAIAHFKSNIPGRVLHVEFDASRSNKIGVKEGDRVFKLGLDIDGSTAFMEYLEHYNQGRPSMAIYANNNINQITISGWQVDKRLLITFTIIEGIVNKAVQMSRE